MIRPFEKEWAFARFFQGPPLCKLLPMRLRGVSGAAVSYIGFGLPAFFIMMILSALYSKTMAC